jgi:hypothetical protein
MGRAAAQMLGELIEGVPPRSRRLLLSRELITAGIHGASQVRPVSRLPSFRQGPPSDR